MSSTRALAENQRRHLRGLAHALKPVVLIGNGGLTDAVIAEATRALQDHELIKLRVRTGERGTRDEAIEELTRRTGGVLVSRIGHVAVLYKAREKQPKIMLPAPSRAATSVSSWPSTAFA